jgi:hypothetical protein
MHVGAVCTGTGTVTTKDFVKTPHHRQQRRYIQVSTPLPLISSTLKPSPEGLSNCERVKTFGECATSPGQHSRLQTRCSGPESGDGTVEIFQHQMKSVKLLGVAPKEFDLHAASLDQIPVKYEFRGMGAETACTVGRVSVIFVVGWVCGIACYLELDKRSRLSQDVLANLAKWGAIDVVIIHRHELQRRRYPFSLSSRSFWLPSVCSPLHVCSPCPSRLACDRITHVRTRTRIRIHAHSHR